MNNEQFDLIILVGALRAYGPARSQKRHCLHATKEPVVASPNHLPACGDTDLEANDQVMLITTGVS